MSGGQPEADAAAPQPVEASARAPSSDPVAQFWQHINDNKVLQWAVGYLGAALALADGEGLVAHAFHWPDLAGQILIGALIVGFPVAVVFAWYHGHKGLQNFSTAELTIVALLVLVGGGGLFLMVRPTPMQIADAPPPRSAAPAMVQSATPAPTMSSFAATLAAMTRLVQSDRYEAAFELALPLANSTQARADAAFQDLWRQIDVPMRPLVSQDGARVSFQSAEEIHAPWHGAGVTPFAHAVDAPRGALRLKIEKPGFRTGLFVVHNPGLSTRSPIPDPVAALFAPVPLELAPDGSIADDMVLVSHTNIPIFVSGWSQIITGSDQHEIPAFAIAKYEVSNREFKAFVDAGGYDNPAYWEGLKFQDRGHALSWSEARKRFVDSTGRPGPAGWHVSTYDKDQGDMPVGGISWYEAVAYARFRGRMLPTIHHWARAAFAPYEAGFATAPAIVLTSRFAADGPIPAHSDVGMGPWGTFNTAGNVREWVWNASGDQALMMGGAWSDYAGLYQYVYPASPMERLPQDGMRLMSPLQGSSVDPELLKPITLAYQVARYDRAPVSNDAFEAMRFQFPASQAPQHTTVQTVKESDLWIAEEVRLSFADNQTLILYVVRPKTHKDPLQVVVYGPPGDSLIPNQTNRDALKQVRPPVDTVVDSGRALVIPIWAGTYETANTMVARDLVEKTERNRLGALAWYPQIRSVLDYLATRPDLDLQRVGYMGVSLGAAYIGPEVIALEGRIRTAILISGGLPQAEGVHPMGDAVNYAPHIKVPVLMIGGRYDHIFLYEQSQKRMFALLGTPPDQKKQMVFESGHFAFPSNSVAMEIGNWLDKYLGPVR
jgi:formylglycine-generating enzyme required for sulfatase activity